MKINCALSPEQIKNLYSNVYGNMMDALNNDVSFDINTYMATVFDKISKKSNPDTASKFVQQIPKMASAAANRGSLFELEVDVNAIRKLIIEFGNETTGIESVMKRYAPTKSTNTKKDLVNQKANEAFDPVQTEDKPAEARPLSLKPFSIFNTSYQEFDAVDPKAKEEGYQEVADETKEFIYTALGKISAANPSLDNAMDTVEYQDKKLYLKPIVLATAPVEVLDKYSTRIKNVSAFFRNSNKKNKNVIQATEIILMAVSDEEGNLLYFDNDGNIVENPEQGRVVYQFLRNVIVEDGKFKDVNIYGYSNQIASPAEISKATGITVEEATQNQQADFKALHEYKKSILDGNVALAPMTGISAGVSPKQSKQIVNLSNLNEFPFGSDSVFRTIDIVRTPRGVFAKGDTVISIDGVEYKIDRPNATDDIIEKVAAVFSNPNISNEEKYNFYLQFFSKNASFSTRKHSVEYSPATDELTFRYSPTTYAEKYSKFETITNLNTPEAKQLIIDTLKFASGTKGKYFEAKMNYDSKLLAKNGYQDYNLETNTLDDEFSNYIELLKTLPRTTIYFSLSSDPKKFNSYISFRIPTEFIQAVEKAKKNPASVEPSPTRKQKNILADYVKGQTEAVETTISQQGKVNVSGTGNEFGIFSITSPATGESLVVSLDKKLFKSAAELVIGTSVSLQVITEETDDMYIPNVIIVKNAEGKVLGRVMETNYAVGESDLNDYYRQLKKQRNITLEEKIEESTNTKGTANPKDGLAGKFFLRDGHLQYDATPEQIKVADAWWKKSDLFKYLDFEQGVAIANSDAFARFIGYGAVLNGKLGMLQIGNKGSMVDVYHEAWHGFSQLFLTPKQKRSLYKEVQRKLGKNKKLSFFDIEEILAEDFRTYAKNPKAVADSPERNSIFRTILNFLKELLGIGSVTNVTDIKKVREYYENLYFNKNLNQYTPSIDNIMWDLLNRNSGVQTLADENIQALNRQDATVLKNSMDAIISKLGDELYSERKQDTAELGQNKSATTKLLEDPRNRNAMYSYIFDQLDTRRIELQEDLEKLEDTPKNFLEKQKIENNIRIITTGLDNWGNQSNGMIQYHIENSDYNLLREKFVTVDELKEANEDEEIKDETDDATDPQNVEASEKFGDKKVGDRSLLELADKEVVYILKSLYKVDRSGKVILNQLGFPELVDFRSTWNNTVRTIRGEQDPAIQYELLKAAIPIHPEFAQLVNFKLADPNESNDLYEAKATTAFWQTFGKPRVPLLQSTIYSNGITQITQASLEAVDILKSFEYKFKADNFNPFIVRGTEDNVPMLNIGALIEEFSDKNGNLDSTRYFEFAGRVGIYLDNLTVIKKELSKNQKSIEEYGLPYIFETVKKLAELESSPKATTKQASFITEFKKNPIYYLRTEIPEGIISDKAETQKYVLRKLADLQARYGLDTSNFGVLNAEGNTVFELIEKSTASKIAYAINKATKLSDLWTSDALKYMSYLNPGINTFTNNSTILKTIFDFNDPEFVKREGKELELFMSSGTQQIIDEDSAIKEGLNTTSLDVFSKFLQETNSMLKGGIQEFIRHASKSSAFGLRLNGGIIGGPNKLDSNPRLYVDIDMFGKGTAESYALRTHIVPYIATEANRIYKFKQNKTEFEKYAGYNNETANGKMAGEVFTAFDNALRPSTKTAIYDAIDQAIANKEYFDFISFIKADKSGLAEKIKTDITDYFNELSEENYAQLQQTNYISPDLSSALKVFELSKTEEDKLLSKAYTYNSWIHNFETINLMYGDMAQYNHVKEEMHKRNTGLTSTGRAFRTDLAAQNLVNGYLRDTSYGAQKGFNTISYNGTFNTAIVQDVERSSVYLPIIKKGLTEDYTKKLQESIKDPAKLKEAVEYRVNNDLEAYKKMTEGDGQGWITFDAYRVLKNLENAWSYEQDQLFQKITKGEFVSPKDIIEMFPVYKVQNFGHLANTGMPVNAMHKFALAPLIPSMIARSDLQSLHEQMMEDNIQYVTFQSGSKVGSVTSAKDSKGKAAADVIYLDSQMKNLNKDINFTPNTIYVDYLKNVTNVNSAFKNKSIFSTQLRKLILGSMYREGKIINPNNAATVKKYEQTVDEYTKLLKFELLNEIGYEEIDGKYIGNLTNFLDIIQRELGKRNLPEHHIGFVGQNPDGSLKTDLSLHLRADDIEKILVSLIEKRFIKQKVKGEPLVQVASTMTNGMWSQPTFEKATDEQVRKFLGTNNLPFYDETADGTTAMKVAIAMQGDFFNLLRRNDVAVYDTVDGKRVLNQKASLAKLNQLIKDEDWLKANRDVVRLSAVRIPVQGINSMEFMEVYEFLDPTAGNIIIPPSEIVAKSGSDFDVDKLITFMPNLDNKGRFIESGLSEEQFQNFVKRNKSNPERVSQTIKTQKAALENRLISSINDILALPDNYANLVRPNATYLLKDIADKLQDFVSDYDRFKNKLGEDYYTKNKDGKVTKLISPTRILETGYNLHKHEVNLTGKTVLGITAIENALHPIFNSLGAAMPKTYKWSYYDDVTKKYVETDINYNTNLYLPHRKTKQGRISLSHTESVDGDSISELFSQMINGLVDVEKDAWIFFIQGNLEVAPTLLYLLKAGVPKEDAIMFVSNPLVREYAKNQRLYKSSYANVAGKVLDNKAYAQYRAATDVIYSQLPGIIEDQLSSFKDTTVFSVKTGAFNDDKQEMEYLSVPMTKLQLIERTKTDNKFNDEFLDVRVNAKDKAPIFVKPSVSNKKYYQNAFNYSQSFLNKNKEFDLDLMKRVILNPKSTKYRGAALGMFMHFIEIEKQIKGLQTLKRLSNPDTKSSKALEEVTRRGLSLEELKDLSKVDPELVRKMIEESILGTFFDNSIISELVKPLFPLRNSDKVSNYVLLLLERRAGDIVKKYGPGAEGTRSFIADYKNSVVNYVFQNYMSNFTDANGNIVNVPTEYKEMQVKNKKGIANGAEVIDNVIYVDEARISKDYNEKLFSAESQSADSYRARGLRPFRVVENAFPTESSFFKYVVEREYQRSTFPFDKATTNKTFRKLRGVLASSIQDETTLNKQTYEAFLNQRALIFAFNREALMKTVNYSYSDQLMSMIAEFSELKDKYPVLNQLTKPSLKTGEKIISLNDSRMLKDAQLAEIYYENIKDLGDPTVKKVELIADNDRISEMFGLLPLVAIYQNGIGFSRFGFNEALPYDKFLDVMDSASKIFLDKQLNNATLRNIYKKIMDPKNRLFKDFVVSPIDFNDPTDTPLESQTITEESAPDEDIAIIPPSTSVKEGVSELFESSPELSKVGTPQQYSAYLDSIFPNSQVKDIVYRADKRTNLTSQTTVDDYTQVYVNGVYYSTKIDYAKKLNETLKGRVYPTVLDIKNPAEIKTKQDIEKLGRNKKEFKKINNLKYKNNPKDSLIFDNTIYKTGDKYGEVGKEIVVFEPEQIHILGSTRDLKQFDDFVNGRSSAQTDIKEGVEELFRLRPELSAIGTPQQYTEYINAIFPDSKIKDIVYHGSPTKGLQELKRGENNQGKFYTSRYGITFTDRDLNAMYYAGQIDNPENGQVYSALVNIKNPQIQDFENSSYESSIGAYNTNLEKAFNEGKDGFIATKIADPFQDQTNIVVFEPEQIHILGDKQDIEGFKTFVQRETNQENPNQNAPDGLPGIDRSIDSCS